MSENASATEPARPLAVFVAEDGAELTTFDRQPDAKAEAARTVPPPSPPADVGAPGSHR